MADYMLKVTRTTGADGSVSTVEAPVQLSSTESQYLIDIAGVDVATEISQAQSAFDNWATLTNAQKDTIIKRMLGNQISLVKIIRVILRQFL